MKRTQADINLLEGKLYRTYVEADSRIFEFAKDDQQMIPAYKVIIEYNYLQKLSGIFHQYLSSHLLIPMKLYFLDLSGLTSKK